MKKAAVFVFQLGIFFLYFNLQGQITFTYWDAAQPGDTIPRAEEGSPAYGPGPSGTGQTWDFSSALNGGPITTLVLNPGATPFSGDFPNSNQSMTSNMVNYLYFRSDSNVLTLEGMAGDLLNDGNNISIQFNPIPDIQQYPVNYGNNFMDTYGFDKTTSGAGFGVDQVRMKRVSEIWDTLDGWGDIITPIGSYECLRQKHMDHYIDTVWVKIFNFSPWSVFDTGEDTLTTYSWIAQESGIAIAEMTLDTADIPDNFTFSLVPPSPLANFTYMDSSFGSLHFTDLSANSPSTWDWDFGDGTSNATQQHPVHLYAMAGTYEVCLSVSNVTGTNSLCDSVTVGAWVSNEIEDFSTFAFTLFPNPSEGSPSILIEHAADQSSLSMEIYSMNGKLIHHSNFELKERGQSIYTPLMDTELTIGVYYYLLKSGSKIIGRAKMVIQ